MNYLMLIDRFSPIPEDFDDWIILDRIQGKFLEKQAKIKCQELLDAAKNDGVDIKILSAYRTIGYQQTLWDESVSKYISCGYTYMEAMSEISKTVALPGHSEHNSGLAVDFSTPDSDDVEDDFYKSAQGRWLCKNAHKYGFILRYPRMKEHLTRIDYEPWHYRYVGAEAAGFIRESGLCLEEFLHFYSENFI